MKFGPVPVEDAAGCLLAHSIDTENGRLKKGHLLTGDSVSALRTAGHENIVVARLEEGDMAEDEAAERIAKVLVQNNLRTEPPFTGRANLFATASGLFRASKDLIDQTNGVDPGITVATLPDGADVRENRMAATVKIIPFAVSSASVEQVLAILSAGVSISLTAYKGRAFGLISTRLPVLKESVIDKTAGVFEKRLKASGSRFAEHRRVEHDVDDLAHAIRVMADARHEAIVVFGASAIADRHDVIPAAIEKAGGEVIWFGMPVDPGNLLLVGKLGNIDIIGAPGCARSPRENGFDWVLNRILAGIEPSPAWIKSLGVGGLLMEIHSRPQPREG